MVYYPLLKMKEMGVTSVLIVSGRGHAGHFLELLGGGSEFGMNIAYEVQEEAGGIAQALALAEDFIGSDDMVVILGDNIFEDSLTDAVKRFTSSDKKAHVFLKEVDKPQSYGVARLEGDKLVEIIEKPENPPSNYAVTGCYLYRSDVFEFIRTLSPSARGELEISSVNEHYIKSGDMSYTTLEKFWGDCGESISQMLKVSNYVMEAGL
ncbi:MAG: glucose-1-phosphate thymidylyltransferase [Oceanicoccus sp.]|jgi:glucose-1-phosphate thymidylyltransferase